jgi:phage tail sheath protein FI
MVQVSYPGVYIQEVPSGVHTITGVATSIAAFVGSFQRGPLNAPMQLLSLADFQRIYGGLDRNSETSYAIQQFFANGGQECWVVRVADTAGPPAAAPAKLTLFNQAANGGAGTEKVVNLTAGRFIDGSSVDDVGEWGNWLRVSIDYSTLDPDPNPNPNPGTIPTTLFNLTLTEVKVDGDRTSVVNSEVYRNLTMAPNTPNYVVDVINQTSQLVYADATNLTPDQRPAPNGTLGGPLALSPTDIPDHNAELDISLQGLVGVSPSTFSIATHILYKDGTPPSKPTTYAQLRPFLEAAIRAGASDVTLPNGLKPLLANATVELLGAGTAANPFRFYVHLGANARPYSPSATISFSGAAVAARQSVQLTTTANQQQYTFDPGSDGPKATLDPLSGTSFRKIPPQFFTGSVTPPRTGMHALEAVDLFNMLLIPEATTLDAAPMQGVYAEAETYVESRRAMLVVDVATSVARLDQMQSWMNDNASLRHPNAAVYFPRVNIPDPLNQSRPRLVAASGTVAGVYARTDATRGVWKAPAGTEATLRNIVSLGLSLTDAENGTLNPLGVNCLRNFPVYGNLCWGARTLEGADVLASEWKYVPVRRLTLYLEESLYRGTKWVVFEPNDEPLWSQIRLNVGAFMQDLFRKEAFQGTTPDQAYFVKCDHETTTQNDIDKGIVNIQVGFAPLKPAEFVILQISQFSPSPVQ